MCVCVLGGGGGGGDKPFLILWFYGGNARFQRDKLHMIVFNLPATLASAFHLQRQTKCVLHLSMSEPRYAHLCSWFVTYVQTLMHATVQRAVWTLHESLHWKLTRRKFPCHTGTMSWHQHHHPMPSQLSYTPDQELSNTIEKCALQ